MRWPFFCIGVTYRNRVAGTQIDKPQILVRSSCDRPMCGVMAKMISFSFLCLFSRAKKYFRMGNFSSSG
jgi:hypothetical protein